MNYLGKKTNGLNSVAYPSLYLIFADLFYNVHPYMCAKFELKTS